MDDFINSKAKEFFGIDYVFPYQRLVISNTLLAAGYYPDENIDEAIPRQIVLLPTGAGKSLCFMLPGILIDGITLIIFPLLSLMADQERRILDSGATVTTLRGGMTSKDKNKMFNLIRENNVKFILTNPETLRTPTVLKLLKDANISQVVIDETHTVSQWGESFRPSYLEVGGHLKTIGCKLITAYTATASEKIIDSVIKHIFLGESINIVRGNPDRVNIHYSVIPTINKKETLLDLVNTVEKPLIIFHSSRVSCEVTNRFLKTRTFKDDIVYYHAGLTKDEKNDIEKWFFDSNSGILNSTCAYGMGVDKQGIRTVIHLEAPSSIEAYLQESGRGGRDRNLAKAILITSSSDKKSEIIDMISNNTCRREVYLNLLGSDMEFCSGCDICDGSYNNKKKGLEQIQQFLLKNKNRYNIEESSRILKGFYSYNALSNQYHNTCGFGILNKWDLDSIKESIELLIDSDIIQISRNPFIKNRLKYK